MHYTELDVTCSMFMLAPLLALLGALAAMLVRAVGRSMR